VVAAAIARELAGFMGAIAQQVPVTLYGQDGSRLNDKLRRVTTVHRMRRSPGVGVTLGSVKRLVEDTRA
jgi:hypothetical protein